MEKMLVVLLTGFSILVYAAGCAENEPILPGSDTTSTSDTGALPGGVSSADCATLLKFAQNADVRTHDMQDSWTGAMKLYEKIEELEAKYGITEAELKEACGT